LPNPISVYDVQRFFVGEVIVSLFTTTAVFAVFFTRPSTKTVTVLMKFPGAVKNLEVESLEHC